ncbi:MAG: NUDIX hydrolase [Thermoplasmata archaeon]
MSEELQALVQRYGGVPVMRRNLEVSTGTIKTLKAVEGGNLGAAGLLWNESGQVLLVRHGASSQWGKRWVTPGGAAVTGESPEDTLLREVWEETGLRARILDLTRVYEMNVTDGEDSIAGFFFQFEAMTRGPKPSPGPGIKEVRWFDDLPLYMAFRSDYLDAFLGRREEILEERKRPKS